mgnify:FL=1
MFNPESEWVMRNENLIQVRMKAGLTQVEVAKKAGIQERAYQNYEAGRKPKSDVAIRIADALGVKSYQDFKKLFG